MRVGVDTTGSGLTMPAAVEVSTRRPPLTTHSWPNRATGAHQKTIGADKNYDTRGFVAEMRRMGVTPHVA